MSSTDAAAIFAVLRSRRVSLKGQLKPLLELESASNDPMAVFLTVTMLTLLTDPSVPWWSAFPAFVKQMLIGGVMGLLLGKAVIHVVNRIRLEYEGLYPVLTLASVLLVFGAAETLGGNGYLAVYLAGVVLGNADFIHKRSLERFHDGLVLADADRDVPDAGPAGIPVSSEAGDRVRGSRFGVPDAGGPTAGRHGLPRRQRVEHS